MDSVFYNIPKRLFFLLPRLPLPGILLFLRLDFAFDVVVLFLILHSRLQFLNLLQELIFPPFSAAMIFSAVVVTDQVSRLFCLCCRIFLFAAAAVTLAGCFICLLYTSRCV